MIFTTNGADLRFYDTLGSELKFEIENWNTNGTSHVWVQVPALTNSGTVRALWGNPNVTSMPAYTTNGATWTNVTQILSGRLLRVGAQFDF